SYGIRKVRDSFVCRNLIFFRFLFPYTEDIEVIMAHGSSRPNTGTTESKQGHKNRNCEEMFRVAKGNGSQRRLITESTLVESCIHVPFMPWELRSRLHIDSVLRWLW